MSRKVDWTLYEQYLRDVAALTLKPAEVSPHVPLNYDPRVDDYTMSSGMAMTPGGRLWLAWFANEDDSQAVIILAHSEDEGRTFSAPEFIVDPGFVPGGLHISAVVGNLWTAPDGRLFLFFMQSIGHFDGRAGVWQAICENPDSDAPTWSVPERLWHGAALNKPIVLDNGTWLLPVSLWPRHYIKPEEPKMRNFDLNEFRQNNSLFQELDEHRGVTVLASHDRGKTWSRSGHVSNPIDVTFDEPMLVERADQSLLMYTRNTHGMTQTESFDEGKSWSTPVKTPFTSASARFFLTKLASGNLLLVRYANPWNSEVRSHMTAYLSQNDGATWEGGLLLDERMPISYPDGFQLQDGRIFVQYDYKRASGEILLAVFTEEDVLAGKPVSGKTVLKRPMMQSFSARQE
jgi:predicted neuraminidase